MKYWLAVPLLFLHELALAHPGHGGALHDAEHSLWLLAGSLAAVGLSILWRRHRAK